MKHGVHASRTHSSRRFASGEVRHLGRLGGNGCGRGCCRRATCERGARMVHDSERLAGRLERHDGERRRVSGDEQLFRGRALRDGDGGEHARRALQRERLGEIAECQSLGDVELARGGVPEQAQLFCGRELRGRIEYSRTRRALERGHVGERCPACSRSARPRPASRASHVRAIGAASPSVFT